MISWIQNTFQHHFRTVFAVLLGLIIVSFVFTIGPQAGFGRDGHSRKAPFFGHDLSSQVDVEKLVRDARVSAMLMYGNANFGSEQLFAYAKERATVLHVANQLRLPNPTPAQLEKNILTMRLFSDEKGQFDGKRYKEFEENLKKNAAAGITLADVNRVMQEDFRRAETLKLLSGEGYALDQSVAADLARAGTEWTIRVARFDYASFAKPAQPTEEQLNKYFTDNSGLFQVGPRASVDTVTFSAAQFIAGVKFTEEELARYFEMAKYRFQTPSTTPGTPPTTPELATVRPQVESALRTELASQSAAKAASDFGYAIFDKKLKKNSPELATLAAQFNGKISTIPPFTENDAPAGTNWSPAATAAAFTLADDRFFSDPVPAGADQMVILWKETLPSYAPTLAEVRAQVLAKYLENEKRKSFAESGIAWKSAVAAKLAAGATLDNAVTGLLGAPKVEVKNLGPFTRRQPPPEATNTVLSATEGLQPGQISEFLLSDKDDGVIVQVAERKAPAVDASNPQYTEARRQKARESSSYFAYAVLRDMQREEQKSYQGSSVARD